MSCRSGHFRPIFQRALLSRCRSCLLLLSVASHPILPDLALQGALPGRAPSPPSIEVFPLGLFVAGATTHSSAMLPVTSPQLLGLRKKKDRHGPIPICNQSIYRLSWTNDSPCLAASDVIIFLPLRFIFCTL